MYYFSHDIWNILHEKIDKNDLHEAGLEKEPHVSIIYGLKSDKIEDIKIMEFVQRNLIPLSIVLDEISLFENEKFDVLKFSVKNDLLNSYHEKFKKSFPNEVKFSYNPHATIAYLKNGTGKKYLEKLNDFRDYSVVSNKVVYSKPNGDKIELNLNNH
jgi:2'-5' RNA ligase